MLGTRVTSRPMVLVENTTGSNVRNELFEGQYNYIRVVCHHCTIDGDDAEPWGDTTASTVKPTTQTEEEEAEQQDTELTQSIQQQCPSGEQAAEPSEKRES